MGIYFCYGIHNSVENNSMTSDVVLTGDSSKGVLASDSFKLIQDTSLESKDDAKPEPPSSGNDI